MGFTSIWTTEHHFVDDGCMPSPFVVSAALAQATSRIGIGTGVVLAPMYNPIRLAEDAATVQLLSHGRLLLGLGLGWSETEHEGLGSDPRQRGAAMEEILGILPRAWTGDPFSHRGEVYRLPRLAVRPRPAESIPILVGGRAETAIRRAARLADGVVSSASVKGFVRQVHWALDECDRNERDPAALRFVYCPILLPGTSSGAARARYGDALWAMTWKGTDMEASARRALPAPPPPATPGGSWTQPDGLIAGSAAEIVEALQAARRLTGVPVEFVAWSYLPSLPIEGQLELMRILAEGVAPHL
jgi:alkanesulfonate monooxygenase SsuD/methylene tetrahydromethanopterin reductase-like flavin-dependent oxidoreductase (luciferase family)